MINKGSHYFCFCVYKLCNIRNVQFQSLFEYKTKKQRVLNINGIALTSVHLCLRLFCTISFEPFYEESFYVISSIQYCSSVSTSVCLCRSVSLWV